VLYNLELAMKTSKILDKLHLESKSYVLATVHRAENTDNPQRLCAIFTALERISKNGMPVILPLHPRTLKAIETSNIRLDLLRIIEPASYLDMLSLEKHAKMIFTDSGGVQKEAYWVKSPCITLRDETEWVETIEESWNVLAGANEDKIVESSQINIWPTNHKAALGPAEAADKIVSIIINGKGE